MHPAKMRYCRKAAKNYRHPAEGRCASTKCNNYFRYWHFSDLPDLADDVRSLCAREDMIWDTQPSSPRQTHPLIGSRAAMSKMLADCEVLYILCSWPGLRWRRLSYFEGGIRCSRQSNGTPDITLANG
jgi:hypothetical protein